MEPSASVALLRAVLTLHVLALKGGNGSRTRVLLTESNPAARAERQRYKSFEEKKNGTLNSASRIEPSGTVTDGDKVKKRLFIPHFTKGLSVHAQKGKIWIFREKVRILIDFLFSRTSESLLTRLRYAVWAN